jgi:biotin synthase
VALEPVPVYPLLSGPQITAYAQKALCPEINRFSLVTSGRGLGLAEVQRLAAELDGLRQMGVELCASLGIIEDRALKALARAGVSRYHHNLETAPSHFSKVCSSHSFVQRQETLQRARANGLSLCSGGIFGLGESDAQVLELGLELDRLNVQAVPVNFYVPIKGTPLAKEHNLSPLRCLKILALLRLLLPDTEIIVCGGREYNLGPLHPFIFQAGASALMTGNYLTTSGRSAGQDLDLLTDLGLGLRPGP